MADSRDEEIFARLFERARPGLQNAAQAVPGWRQRMPKTSCKRPSWRSGVSGFRSRTTKLAPPIYDKIVVLQEGQGCVEATSGKE